MNKKKDNKKTDFEITFLSTINKMSWILEKDVLFLQKIEELVNKLVLISAMLNGIMQNAKTKQNNCRDNTENAWNY